MTPKTQTASTRLENRAQYSGTLGFSLASLGENNHQLNDLSTALWTEEMWLTAAHLQVSKSQAYLFIFLFSFLRTLHFTQGKTIQNI